MTTPRQPGDTHEEIMLTHKLQVHIVEEEILPTITLAPPQLHDVVEETLPPVTLAPPQRRSVTPEPVLKPKGDKKILLDSDVDKAEQSRYRTPGALDRTLADNDRLSKPIKRMVRAGKRPFDKFGRIDVDPVVNEENLMLTIKVTCNPKYMCEPHDLVPVMMETQTDRFAFTIAVLRPTPESNYHEITVVYSLKVLAEVLGVEVKPSVSPLQAIQQVFPELGVKAQWLADTTGGGNQPNHVSGGVFEKGGSGKIILRPRTMEDFEATIGVRNLEWNMAERLTEDRARPVYLAFDDILAESQELATTIEAESEFMCSPKDLSCVIGKMDELTRQMSKTKSFDLLSMLTSTDRDAIKIICPSMIEMKKEVKVYVDTYYEIVPSNPQLLCPLLSNRIVLRRRQVSTDPEGTFLFTLKGSSCTFGKERLRYAAQINLIEEKAEKAEGLRRIRDLMCDTFNKDNAFAICFQKAVTDCGLGDLLNRTDWVLEKKFKVTSTRDKYSMKFVDNTVLEFSADSAEGEFGDRKATVCSFELGVGHPGLTTAGTTTYASMDAQIALWGQKGGWRKGATGPKPMLITRPYHLWEDVCNENVLRKNDFQFFAIVRDLLLHKYFGIPAERLTTGGNKGSELAKILGIIGQ